METNQNNNKPQAIREGKHIKHYIYRGIRIDRWVNDTGYYMGSTTIYQTAGTKFNVSIKNRQGCSDNYTADSLGNAVRFINKMLDGYKIGSSTVLYRAENGILVFNHQN